MIKENKQLLSKELNNFENKLNENLDAVIQNSINEVSGLSRPLEKLMKDYFQEMKSPDKLLIENIWPVNSLTKVNEEIQKFITTTKEDLTIIVPQLENHLAVEQFDKIPKSLKIKIASSEPHTNSSVKNFTSIANILYKTLENENLIALKGDDSQITIGVILKGVKDTLNDFIGIGSNFKPLIELLSPIVQNSWESGYSDTFYASQKAQAPTIKAKSGTKVDADLYKKVKPITTPKFRTMETEQKIDRAQEIKDQKTRKKVVPQEIPSEVPKYQEEIEGIKQKLQEKIKFVSTTTKKKGDEAGLIINNAFNNLVQKLHNIKGEEFSKELQKIADLVLEKRGFSVTLHQLRSLINQYRFNDTFLNELDTKQILANIESWKEKLV
jgi:hypothetical protein